MFRILDISGKCILSCGVALTLLFPLHGARADAVLYSFNGGSDGDNPGAGLVRDSARNLYGTTEIGGGNGCGGFGCGTIFKLAPDGTETVLHSFGAGSDGINPRSGLIMDSTGNLYGTTQVGGGPNNAGTVFKVAPDGTETVLYSFKGGSDGSNPFGDLIKDSEGNLFGTTVEGGHSGCNGGNGCGTVFKLATSGTETALYLFTGGSDGASPYAGLAKDRAGNLYSTTYVGGANNLGTVFKLAPNGAETVLLSFRGYPNDGQFPWAGLIRDNAGNLYGTTTSGGTISNDGTAFKLAPDGTETILHSFTNQSDGGNPYAAMIMDKTGNLYGTAPYGGATGYGVVFKLAPDGTEKVLHSFTGNDGANSFAGLIGGKKSQLYGTTAAGGANGYGTVFKLKEQRDYTPCRNGPDRLAGPSRRQRVCGSYSGSEAVSSSHFYPVRRASVRELKCALAANKTLPATHIAENIP
jgi:uncharacterized repeat protein (TIGR03803 family)